jgi:hypothetical protein
VWAGVHDGIGDEKPVFFEFQIQRRPRFSLSLSTAGRRLLSFLAARLPCSKLTGAPPSDTRHLVLARMSMLGPCLRHPLLPRHGSLLPHPRAIPRITEPATGVE